MIRKMICVNSAIIAGLAAFFFSYPSIRAALDMRDPALRQAGVPKAAWRLYRNLTPRYANWARQRVAEGRAAALSKEDISGTEWPLFGSVFYLWALTDLQAAWDAGDHTGKVEPKVFARDAIIAASELVIDPRHASWVKKHWGEDYLHRENVFYRMLVIAALTSREQLLHDGAHLDLLRDQVETFSKELYASKSGLLDDYPGQCYPGDVMAALMCIKRADAVLGTDHSGFNNRALRGFTESRATRLQLPPYSANSDTGSPASPSRGCANSYMCLTGPELWPAQARQWFEIYDKHFWQRRITAVGFREFAQGEPRSDWTWDVDAGPVIAGYGAAANAFGVGAARKNGRFDRAYPLAAEMLATMGELPTGTLMIPRLLSNLSDAPYLGEAALLWQLSVQPEKGFPLKTGGSLPAYVYIVLISAFLVGALLILEAVWMIKTALFPLQPEIWAPKVQATAWICLLLGSVALFWFGRGIAGTAVLIPALAMPFARGKRASKRAENRAEA